MCLAPRVQFCAQGESMKGQRRTSDESKTKIVVLRIIRSSYQRKQEELDSMFAHDEPDEHDDSDLVDDEEEPYFEEPVPPSAHYAERTLLDDASGDRSSSTR